MSTKIHTFVRSALAVTVASVLSAPSFGATLTRLPSTTIIPSILISDLLVEPVVTETEFAGKQLLDTIGRYKSTPMVYQAVELDKDPVAKSFELLKRLNAKFNTERFIHLNDKWFGFQSDKDPSATFEFDGLTGNLHFNAGLMPYSAEEPTAGLPNSNDELINIAARYLIDLQLLPPLTEINLQKIEFGGLNMAIPDEKGGSKIFEKLKTVRAYRILDGLEVEGAARLVLNIGEKGALAGIVSQWPTLSKGQPLTEADLIPAVKIREAALANIQRVIGKSQRPELTDVKLVLYDDGHGIIEPAYHFVVNRNLNLGESTRGAELSMIPFDFYLPIFNKSRADFPDMEAARVQPLDGRDLTPVNAGQDDS